MNNLTSSMMAAGAAATGGTGASADGAVTPRRLELSINPEDGSLMTAPLLSVLFAGTNSLYDDLYNMAQAEVQLVQPATNPDEDDEEANEQQHAPGEQQQQQQQQGQAQQQQQQQQQQSLLPGGTVIQKEKMSNMSFAQRRHELSWRLASHGRALTHIAALTAAAASTDLANATRVSTNALQHARTAWVQADEAQDALYFFHAQLFPARQAPHDIYGALDTLLCRSFPDMPQDLQLIVDRYETSKEKTWSGREVADRWNMAVRDKLLLGEMGWMKQNHVDVPWKIQLHGGIVRLTHGKSKTISTTSSSSSAAVAAASTSTNDEDDNDDDTEGKTNHKKKNANKKTVYPIEAILTVFTTPDQQQQQNEPTSDVSNIPPSAEWTLVSVEVHAQAKTGQSNHQLDTTNRQRYDLHRLCALAMAKEESRTRQLQIQQQQQQQEDESPSANKEGTTTTSSSSNKNDTEGGRGPIQSAALSSSSSSSNIMNDNNNNLPIARPLHALFQVAHVFSLSWQLEILSAQAQALRKGIWGGSSGNTGGGSGGSGSGSGGRGSTSMTSGRTSTSSSSSSSSSTIVVTPVQFFENRSILGIVSISFWSVDDRYGPPCMGDLHLEDDDDDNDDDDDDENENGQSNNNMNGAGDGKMKSNNNATAISSSDSVSTVSRSINTPTVTNQLTLAVRAEANGGIKVSLTGAESIMEFAASSSSSSSSSSRRGQKQQNGHNDEHDTTKRKMEDNDDGDDDDDDDMKNKASIRATIEELLEATSNPFCLSASEALLAATKLCAERKCYAMVQVLPTVLPKWITLTVERGSIAVAAQMKYFYGEDGSDINNDPTKEGGNENQQQTHQHDDEMMNHPVILFRLACDARTGNFTCTFSRSTKLLQFMACNDMKAASDSTALRLAALAKHRSSRRMQQSSSRLSSSSSSAAALTNAMTFASGRAVRDAFDGLSRSMNILGQRTGVGGAWKDNDDMSSSLRQRSIHLACRDVRTSLMTCCGMAAIYGMSAVAIGIATGIQPTPDMGGGSITEKLTTSTTGSTSTSGTNNKFISFLSTPPLSLLMDQNLIEKTVRTSDGEKSTQAYTEQEFFGIICSISDHSLTLYGLDMKVHLDTPNSAPIRNACTLVPFKKSTMTSTSKMETNEQQQRQQPPPSKRIKMDEEGERTSSSSASSPNSQDLMIEVENFASIISDTLELD